MNTDAELRELLLQYRLNELSDERREEIDVLLISDPDFSASMQDCEYDLLDAYAAGELSVRDRSRVEQALAPAGRFSPAAPGRVIEPPVAIGAAQRSIPLRFPARHLRLWAVAACLLVVAALTSVLYFRKGLAGPPDSNQAQTSSPLPDSASKEAKTVPEAAAVPVEIAAKSKPKHTIQSTAVVLLPSTFRSQNEVVLTVAHDVKTVRFVWSSNVEAPKAKGYEIQVVREDGSENCRVRGKVLAGNDSSSSFHFDCPADKMEPGTSFVRVLTLPGTQDAVPILEVALSVRRQ